MCRLFGTLSMAPVDASAELCKAPHSLLHQSYIDKKRPQGDGWGVGWFEKSAAHIAKSAEPMYKDRKKLFKTARRIKTHCLLGHVRWASNPLKLPKHELIGITHSQPFQHKSWIFVHNGTLYIPREVQTALGPWKKFIKGRNDSEVLFYWLMKNLNPLLNKKKVSIQQIGKAVKQSFRGLDAIWATCRRKYPLYKHAYHGVNWVLTNGKIMIALCYVDSRGFDKAKALCSSGQPYYQLQLQNTSHSVTVASEPLNNEIDWQPTEHGELLMAQAMPHGIKLDRLHIL